MVQQPMVASASPCGATGEKEELLMLLNLEYIRVRIGTCCENGCVLKS